MNYREQMAREYYSKSFSELSRWQQAEVISAEYFKSQKCKVELQKQCNEGFDLLINEKYRIDVKFSDGKKRSQRGKSILSRTELEFNIRKKRKGEKTTDFYLIVFYQKRKEKVKLAGYLIPYEDMPNINEITIHREKVKNWIQENELSTSTLRKNDIYKFAKKMKTAA